VFTNGYEYIIAADLDEAMSILSDTHRERYDAPPFRVAAPSARFAIWLNADGTVGEHHGEGCTLTERTFAEWLQLGRGFLCSTEQ
jgi:hypothetical protein